MSQMVVSHYRIEGEIGRGGMGVVYRAIDTKLGRPVAIKVLPPEATADPQRHRRFMQEARKHIVLPGGHVPQDIRGLFKEVLDWYDLHLGAVK